MLPASLPASAIVALTSIDSAPLSWTADVRDPSEAAIFRQVPAGAYRLIVRLPGFREATADVQVQVATMHEFVVELGRTDDPGAESSLRLTRAEPLGNASVFDRSLLETFPGDDALASVVETVVAPLIVDRMSNGGLWLGEAALVGGHGSSWRQTSIVLGDLDVTDPVRTGTPLVRASREAIESLLVSTILLPASVGGPGPVLKLVPKPPESAWHGATEVGFVSPALQSANVRHGAPSIARFAMQREWNAQLGGPLGPRAGLFLSARRVASERLERSDPTRLRTSVSSLFANTTVRTGSQGQLRLAATADRTETPYAGRARFRNRDVRETDTFATVQAAWDRWTNGGTAWSASSGFARGVFSPALDAVPGSDLSTAAGTVERLLDGPVPTLFEGFPGTRQRWTARIDVDPVIDRLAQRHMLHAGASVTHNSAMTFSTASPSVAELVNGIPARIWEYGYAGSEARWASTELAAYFSDRIILVNRVHVDAGVRVDMARGSARDATNPISWLSSAPRVRGRWLLNSQGRLGLFGGYARYMHRLPLDYFAYGDPAAAAGLVYRWNDSNSDRVLQEGERGNLIAAVGPCCTRTGLNHIDPNLKRPHTNELVIGVDGRIGPWSVRVMGVARRERHLVASVNTGVARGDYVLRYITDTGEPFRDPPEERPLAVYDRQPSSFGQDRYLLTNAPGHDGLYEGLEVTVESDIARTWRTRFDGTAYRSYAMGANRGFRALENDQGLIGELFENPNAETYARGHGFFDRAYVIKWWASYRAPKQYVVSAVARYQDGQPFARMAVVSDLNQGPEAIPGYRPGRTRFTFTLSVDAHVEKAVTIGKTKLAGILEVFNLLNTDNEVEEDVVTIPSFRRPTAVQPPRAARIGLRIAF